jgi:hypothetical protein
VALPIALLLVAALAAPAPVLAVQSAACEIPAAQREAAAPAATPAPAPDAVIQIEGSDAATAVAPPVATPATPAPLAPDPLASLTAELTAVSEALAACLSAGDAEMVTRLAAERYLGQLFGGSVPLPKADYIALATSLTPIPTRIVSLEDVEQSADDRAAATVTHIVGNQLMRAEWTFEHAPRAERRAGESPWWLAGERQMPAPPPRGAAIIDVEIGDRSFTLDETTVAGPDVVLRGDNVSAADHEMLVLRFAPELTTADLLRAAGPDLPPGVTFIGELPVKTGDQRDLVLVDLEPGTYTLVCLFPDAQGTPHLAQGEEAVFTVE